jgi:sulfur carrier protein
LGQVETWNSKSWSSKPAIPAGIHNAGEKPSEYHMALEKTAIIHVQLNGRLRELPEGSSVQQALEYLGIEPKRIAIEINQRILRKAEWQAVRIQNQDVLEIVQFVGGG